MENSDNPQRTHFLNVDLDIYSRRDLEGLVKAFGAKVFVLYVGREGSRYSAHLELAKHTKTADATIRGFCKIIAALPAGDRKAWDAAISREFSIGIQAGREPSCADFAAEPATVKAVSELRGRIVVSVYAPPTSAPRGTTRGRPTLR